MRRSHYDVVVVGGGHNALVAATLLGRAGRTVVVLERRTEMGGAAVSGSPFPGVEARLSRYSYLVSMFPRSLMQQLGLDIELRSRAVRSYSPHRDGGLLVTADRVLTEQSMTRATGDPAAHERWERFYARLAKMAQRLFPTLMEPLRSRQEIRALIDDDEIFTAVFEEPLGALIEDSLPSDLVRGTVLTDGLIGTFSWAGDPLLRQNRCFLYHVMGNGTGSWNVPVGGMGAISDQLRSLAAGAGAELRTSTEVASLETDDHGVQVQCAEGDPFQARHLLAGVAPEILRALLKDPAPAERPEGAQLKINMLLARLPGLRDPRVSPEQAFTGTFHVNEGYGQLQEAYGQAAGGRIPTTPPCELYCHTLTDPTILSPALRDAGVHALTLFGLHMPARLFRDAPEECTRDAVDATLRSVNSVLAEPLEDCLLRAPDGTVCLEAVSPVALERELAMPGGHIFHRDLSWPFAETEEEAGQWGVETGYPNIWLCGSGARRGGCVSGIPGHNAAQAVLASS